MSNKNRLDFNTFFGIKQMKRINNIFILIFSLIFILNVNAQEKMTLSNAITIALHQNTSVVKSSNSLETNSAAIKNAYGNLLPSLDINGSWNWQKNSSNQTTYIDSLGRTRSYNQSSSSSSQSRNYGLSASGSLTLFDGLSTFSNINQKKTDLQSAKYDLDKLRQDVILQTVNLFVTIVNDEKILKFQEEDLKYNNDLSSKINEMFNLRMAVNSDVYSQEYQTSNSKFAYLQAKVNFEKAKISILTYLSKDVTNDYTYVLDSAYVYTINKNINNLDSLYQVALNNRRDYQSQKLKLSSAEYGLTIARSGLLPNLSGNYSYSTSSYTPQNLFQSNNYGVGLSLNVPVFSHWSTEYAIESAQVQINNTKEDLNALERQVKSDVKSALLDFQTSAQQLDVTKSALLSAKETWEIKRDSYMIGTATYIDQQLAYRDYIQATNNNIAAGSNFVYKQFGLLSALGQLETSN
jgi:outer membrane protein